eukprot:6205924-Pleurochrysis_carterae.AAC.1
MAETVGMHETEECGSCRELEQSACLRVSAGRVRSREHARVSACVRARARRRARKGQKGKGDKKRSPLLGGVETTRWQSAPRSPPSPNCPSEAAAGGRGQRHEEARARGK